MTAPAKPPSFHRNCVTDLSGGTIVGAVGGRAPVLETVLPRKAGFRLIENRHSRYCLADTLRGLLPRSRGYRRNNDVLGFGSQRAVGWYRENFDDNAIRLALTVVT